MQGKAVATSRLISFSYPLDLAVEDLRPEMDAATFQVGTYIVFDIQIDGKPRMAAGRILSVFGCR